MKVELSEEANAQVDKIEAWWRRNRLGAWVPNGLPTLAENFLGELGPGGTLKEGTWAVFPVSIRTDAAGLLTFSDDTAGTIHKIGYRP